MLGSALATKPRATKRDATTMIRSLGFGLGRNAKPRPVDSTTVKLMKRGPEYSIFKTQICSVTDVINEALVASSMCIIYALVGISSSSICKCIFI